MKTLLKTLKAGAVLTVGKYEIGAYSEDGSLHVRALGSGLMGPDAPPTIAGLRSILRYIDTNPN